MANKGVKQRQAYRVLTINPKTLRYQPKKKKDDEMIEALLLKYSEQYPNYGFKLLFSLLRQSGYPWKS